jgi:hypothetical protein
MHRITASSLVLFALVLPAGCGGGMATVTGSVSLDGQPVKSGSIAFVRTEGEALREGGVIRDGTFEVSLPPGAYKIELNAPKVAGTRKQKGFDGKEEVLEITEELFPAKFNSATQLTETFKPGSNPLTLDLHSK